MSGEVGFVMGSSSDYLVGNHLSSNFWGSMSPFYYNPAWNMRGSLCLSSANSKKALSGFTAHLKFDQRGKCLEDRTISRLMVAILELA
jgi:hypothetical protein